MQLIGLHTYQTYLSLLDGEESPVQVVVVPHPELLVEVAVDIYPAVFGQLIVFILVGIFFKIELAQGSDVLLPEGCLLVDHLVIALILLAHQLAVAQQE